MAISDSLDSSSIGGATTTTTTMSDSDRNLSLRKSQRPAAIRDANDVAELDNSATAVEASTESANSIARNGKMIGNGDNHAAGLDIKFAYRPSVPAHRRIKESPLSSDAIFKQSHAGLFNLCIVVLVAVNSRLIIENLMKYGWLIKTGFWFSSKSLSDWPLLMCCLTLPLFPLSAFLVEKLAQRNCLSDPVVVLLHVIITTAAILYPVFVILRCNSAFLSGVTLMLFACIVWLKLVSYAHTNYDMRALANSADK